MNETFLDGRVVVKVGDITEETTDAIVNAANSSLTGGAGVDGAIHRKGGPEILAECRQIRATDFLEGLPTRKAVITTAGRLPAKFVIHTVGPIYGRHAGQEPELLEAAYANSLRLAVEHQLRSIAFPSISTGAYGYPKDEAARIASSAIGDFLRRDSSLQEVRLIFFHPSYLPVFLQNAEFGD